MVEEVGEVMTLDEASAIAPGGEGRFSWSVPAGWEQGRGAYGGLIAAAMTRAMLVDEEPERVARALSASMTAPVSPGQAEIHVDKLRAGNAVSSWTARLVQDGEVKAVASLVTGRERPTGHDLPANMPPNVPRWQDVPISESVKPPLAPVFTRHFELRALPPYPFSGSSQAGAMAWVRSRVAPARLGPVELAALVDVCWPTALSIERVPRPMATIAFHCTFLVPGGGLDPNEPLLHRGTVVLGAQGYLSEIRELWTGRGELVCHNPQVFAWIK